MPSALQDSMGSPSTWQLQLLLLVLLSSLSPACVSAATADTGVAFPPATSPRQLSQVVIPVEFDNSTPGHISAPATTAAPDSSVIYNCSLAVEGFGNSSSTTDSPWQDGIKSANLNCTSTPPDAALLQVAYTANTTAEFVSGYRGVHPVANSSCKVKLFENETSLFYICGTPGMTIHLWEPSVVGVWLEPPTEEYKDLSVLAFGGNGTVVVHGGNFVHNRAGTPLVVVETVDLTLRSVNISHNAAMGGGGLRVGDSAVVTVTDGSVIANNSAGYGGAVYIFGSAHLVLANSSVLSDNIAKVDGEDLIGNGGAVYAKDTATVIITNHSMIKGNTACYGGGISLEGQTVCVITHGAVVASNSATYWDGNGAGGGVFLKDSARCDVYNARIVDNRAGKQGGGVALANSNNTTLTISNWSVISGNSANTQGGGVYVGPGNTASIEGGSQVLSNTALNGGGVMLLGDDFKGTSRLFISGPGTVLARNTASNGAAINVFASDPLNTKECYVTVSNGVSFEDNAAEEGGGAFVGVSQCSATFTGVDFDRNAAVKFAGVLSLTDSATATFTRCNLSSSTAKDGAAILLGKSSKAMFVDSLVENHRAIYKGGAMKVVENASVTFKDSVVQRCEALDGGAIGIENNGTVVLINSTLTNNRANTTGGAVSLLKNPDWGPGYPSFVMKEGSKCTNNVAAVSGGCAYLLTAGSLEPDPSSSIENNSACYGGGTALAAWQSAPDLSKLRSVSRHNTARMFAPELYIDWSEIALSAKSITANGQQLAVTPRPGGVIPYVSRSAGPGLSISVVAAGNACKQPQPAESIKVDAILWDDKGVAAQAYAETDPSSSGCTRNSVLPGNTPPGQASQSPLGQATTDDSGIAAFPGLQIQQPPGNYSLVFQYTTLDGVPYTLLFVLNIRHCVLGEVTGKLDPGEAPRFCDVCPPGKYSLLDPINQECQLCADQTAVATRNCSAGGAVVLPLPGYWQRSPGSALMHRCFNPTACPNHPTLLLKTHPFHKLAANPELASTTNLGGTANFLVDSKTADPNSNSFNGTSPSALYDFTKFDAYLEAQCGEGYTGRLCASCKPGYGMTRQFHCSICMAPGVVALVYTLGVTLLMIGIRAMVHFNTNSDNEGMKRWASAALAVSQELPPTAAADPGKANDTRGAVGNSPATSSDAGPSAANNVRRSVVPYISVMERQKLVPALPSSVLKVLILYMQYMLIITGLDVSWPASLTEPFRALAWLWSSTSSGEAIAIECFMPSRRQAANTATNATDVDHTGVPAGVIRVLVYICAPIVIYMVMIIFEMFWKALKPWFVPACYACLSRCSHTRAGSFILGLARLKQAGSTAPVPEPAGPEVDLEGDAYDDLNDDILQDSGPAVSEFLFGVRAPNANSLAAARQGSDTVVHGSGPGLFPSVAWCGVLAMVLVFFFLTSLARASLGLFMCYTLQADPGAWQQHGQGLGEASLWIMDMNQQCYGYVHKNWALGLGVPLMLLVYGCLPIAVAVLLFRYRNRLTDRWVQRHFGFLYVHYRPEQYLWEVVTILQTLFVVIVSVTANYLGIYNQALLLNVVLAVIFAMSVLLKPNASREVQLLNYASVGVQLLTTYAALSFISGSPTALTVAGMASNEQAMNNFKKYKMAMGVFVLIANLAFIVGLVLVLLMTLPCAFWKSWRAMLVCQWTAVQSAVTTCCGCRRPRYGPPAAPSMLSLRTSSGRPVLVRLDAQRQVQLLPPRRRRDVPNSLSAADLA